MSVSVNQALRAGHRKPANLPTAALPRLHIAGAGGALGNAVLRRLVGMQRARHTHVLASLPMGTGLRNVSAHVVAGEVAQWPIAQHSSDWAVVMFDPPRMFYGRERALWTPAPEQLTVLGHWLRGCGVHTLAVVLPHAQGSLPEALKRGLASLDEHALAACGFDRLLIVRTAHKPAALVQRKVLDKLAAWMLGIFSFMVPSSEQPVRASKVAQWVDLALQDLPPGTWVAAPELVWQAAQGDAAHMRAVLAQWLSKSS